MYKKISKSGVDKYNYPKSLNRTYFLKPPKGKNKIKKIDPFSKNPVI